MMCILEITIFDHHAIARVKVWLECLHSSSALPCDDAAMHACAYMAENVRQKISDGDIVSITL